MNKKTIIDGVLVTRFQSGDNKAMALLVKRWHKTFCEKAYWLVKDVDVAKDIAQDSWSIVVLKINNLKNPESFGSWALRIVYTKSLDWLKVNKRKQYNLADYKYKQEIDNLESFDNEAIKTKLIITIRTLSKQQQQVIQLFYVEDYSLKDIAKTLNISVGTAKSRLFHAREKLKQILKHNDYEN